MENVIFRQSFMGFDRTQVLKYIDDLSGEMNEAADRFRKEQKDLESQIDTLSRQVRDAQNSLDAGSETCRHLEKDVSALKSENEELKRQILLYRGMITERDKEITKIKTEYNGISEKAQQLMSENAEWKSKQDEIAACMVEASVRAKKIIADANRQAEKTKREFETNASQLMTRVTDVKSEIASLEKQLDDSFRKLTDAVRDMDSASAVIEKQVNEYNEKVSDKKTFLPETVRETKAEDKSDKKSLTDSMLDTIEKLLKK